MRSCGKLSFVNLWIVLGAWLGASVPVSLVVGAMIAGPDGRTPGTRPAPVLSGTRRAVTSH